LAQTTPRCSFAAWSRAPADGLAADHLDIEGAGGRAVMRAGGMPDVDLGVLVHGLRDITNAKIDDRLICTKSN